MTRIGLLTGGGDCPGLDAVIRAVVRRGVKEGHSFVGFRSGWIGLTEDDTLELTVENTSGILASGGTILGTSRTDPMASGDTSLARIRDVMSRREVDALVVVGGNGTLSAALDLHRRGIPLVGVPKTIDNDIAETELSVGFQTAVQTAADAIDRLHTTAESHHRVMVVEVMGRNTGWIAACAGMAGGADAILVPERPFDLDAVCRRVRARYERGRSFSIVVVAEGAAPAGGEPLLGQEDARGHARLGGIGVALVHEIERRTGFETRVTTLGHLQRGGTPVASDRILATRFGVAASDAATSGRFGTMIALVGGEVIVVDIARALRTPKTLDPALYETAELFFG
jgi:phosphofructokinase-like protein